MKREVPPSPSRVFMLTEPVYSITRMSHAVSAGMQSCICGGWELRVYSIAAGGSSNHTQNYLEEVVSSPVLMSISAFFF